MSQNHRIRSFERSIAFLILDQFEMFPAREHVRSVARTLVCSSVFLCFHDVKELQNTSKSSFTVSHSTNTVCVQSDEVFGRA